MLRALRMAAQTLDLDRVFHRVDPRLVPSLREELARRRSERGPPLPDASHHVVLAGHRAAGKSSLLPLISASLRRQPVDLDRQIKTERRRSLREWVQTDEPGFRAAERAVFQELPPGRVVAVGGGFLSLHADLLAPHFTAVVPICFETYCERLRADTTRPRLRPELSLEEELKAIYTAREAQHAAVPTHSFVDLLLALLAEAGP